MRYEDIQATYNQLCLVSTEAATPDMADFDSNYNRLLSEFKRLADNAEQLFYTHLEEVLDRQFATLPALGIKREDGILNLLKNLPKERQEKAEVLHQIKSFSSHNEVSHIQAGIIEKTIRCYDRKIKEL